MFLLVDLCRVEDKDDILELQGILSHHFLYTNSANARRILTGWNKFLPRFVKVIPFEYKKVLEVQKLRELERQLKSREEMGVHD